MLTDGVVCETDAQGRPSNTVLDPPHNSEHSTASQASVSLLPSDPDKEQSGDSNEHAPTCLDITGEHNLNNTSALSHDQTADSSDIDSPLEVRPVASDRQQTISERNRKKCSEENQTAGEVKGLRTPLSVVMAVSGKAKSRPEVHEGDNTPGKYGEDAYFIIQKEGLTFMGDTCLMFKVLALNSSILISDKIHVI